MSQLNNTRKSIRPGSDGLNFIPAEISCVFKFGKDHPSLIFDDFHEFELSEASLNEPIDNDCTLNSAAATADILKIKNQLKLLSSLQVHSSDGSLISVFNTESQPSPSSTNYTQLETSFDLPVGDTSYIEQLLNQTEPSSFADLDLDKDLFEDFLKSEFDFTTDMTIDPTLNSDAPVAAVASSNTFIESNETSSPYLADSLMHDETTSSPISHISEESETQPIHRRQRRTATNKTESETSAARKLARFGNKQVIKYSDEYHDRRLKNNEAVKKSRMKAKEKQKSSEMQMSQLSEENRRLTDRLEMLTKELQVLRSLYKDLKRDGVASNNHV